MTLAQSAGNKLQQLLSHYSTQNISCLLLLSAGSALQMLEFVDGSTLGPWLTITVADERYSLDPTINNFAQLAETNFYIQATHSGCGYIDTRAKPNESADQLAARFSLSIQDWLGKHPTGKILYTLGVGTDGHTLGIMPYPEKPEWFTNTFDKTSELVVVYDATGKNQYSQRVTTTFPILRQASHIVVFAAGLEKAQVVDHIYKQNTTLAQTPASIIKELKSTIELYATTRVE